MVPITKHCVLAQAPKRLRYEAPNLRRDCQGLAKSQQQQRKKKKRGKVKKGRAITAFRQPTIQRAQFRRSCATPATPHRSRLPTSLGLL